MSQQLINRNPDLKRLRDDGYDIEIRSGHLLVKRVPYVNTRKEIRFGTLVTPLGELSGDTTRPPANHVAHLIGEYPCDSRGLPIEKIRNSSARQVLAKGVAVD